MYGSFLFLCLCDVTAGTSFQKAHQSITNVTEYPIPPGTIYYIFHANMILDIPPGYFAAASSIQTIYLQINQLTVIEKHMFAGLLNLRDLRVHLNKIYTIQPDSFKDNMALARLEIQYNLLQSIPESVFDLKSPPLALHTFLIHGNPLRCESLCWLKQVDWIYATYPHLILCGGTGALSGCRWNELTKQEICAGRLWSL